MPEFVEFCSARAAELRSRIESLVRMESPSLDKAAVDQCGAALARMLGDAGAAVTTVPQPQRGDHVRAEIPGDRGRVLLLGHFDTVWNVGQLQRMPLHESDGKLYGPGVFDMKAGIAVGMLAAEAVATLLPPARRPTIVMLWTTDEEIGSGTSRALIESEAAAADAVLVLEPSLPGGAVKTERKGCGEFLLRVRGVSAHAGVDPGKGASAIHELAHLIIALQGLNDPVRGITVNVGVIRGGTRANVIAEQAEAVIDVRAHTMDDAARIESAIVSLAARDPRVTVEISGGIDRPPMERTPGVIRLYHEARKVAAAMDRELAEGATGGGSDGNFTAALGVPTLDGLGPEGDGAHALHEHVVLADLPARAALVAGLIRAVGEAVK